MPLRSADITATKRFTDGEAWLVLRTVLTKGEGDAVRDLSASYRINPQEIADQALDGAQIEVNNRVAQANRALFEILADSWSLGEVSGAAYSALDEESGRWVDECIAEVLAERRARAEGNGRSAKRPSRRGTSSAKAAASS